MDMFWGKAGLLLASATMSAACLAARPATLDETELVRLINTYRGAPGPCRGSTPAPAPALRLHPILSGIDVRPGAFIESALEQAGYAANTAQAIHVRGPDNAALVMDTVRASYCRSLLDPRFADIGVGRNGNDWRIVLAEPSLPLALPDQSEAGQAILSLVNEARASARRCGSRYFARARPVAWNDALAQAAREHSSDMAAHRRFSHRGSDNSEVAQRATRAGYRWRHIGENIAAGQTSAREAVAGWLESPGHCANLMNPDFTEMGAGYAISRARLPGFAYWTQVFATP